MTVSRHSENASSETLVVACPACGKKIAWDTRNQHRPFCSERCKLADLGAWASERYRVAGEAREDDAPSSSADD